MFSTMITVASTIKPKSIAPTERRFADSPQHKDADGEKQREGNGGGDDHCAPQVAEKYPLYEENQNDAENKVMKHGIGGNLDKVAAIIDALDPHAGRQNLQLVDPFDFRFHPPDRRQALLAAAHQDDALDDIVVVVPAGDTEPRLVADGDVGNVADADRIAIGRRQHRVTDVVNRANKPYPRARLRFAGQY